MKSHSLALAFSYLLRSKGICPRFNTTVLGGERGGQHGDAALTPLHSLLCSQSLTVLLPTGLEKSCGTEAEGPTAVVWWRLTKERLGGQDIFSPMPPSFPEKEAGNQSRGERLKWGQAAREGESRGKGAWQKEWGEDQTENRESEDFRVSLWHTSTAHEKDKLLIRKIFYFHC